MERVIPNPAGQATMERISHIGLALNASHLTQGPAASVSSQIVYCSLIIKHSEITFFFAN
jgi:hypothetical protein